MGLVELQSFIDGLEGVQPSAQQHHGAVAMGFDEAWIMRNHDQCAVAALLKELDLAALAEAVVTDGEYLVNQVAIEFDHHREGEGQPGTHAGGVGFHRLSQVATEFCEIFDEVDLVIE